MKRRHRKRPYAIRKPKGYQVKEPSDIVQVGTLDLRPLPGVVLKHFTARDVVSRWDVIEAHSRATANTASMFLDSLIRRTPFPIKAIQVDGGSEFEASFEQACRERGIKLFVLPPRSPKLNGLQDTIDADEEAFGLAMVLEAALPTKRHPHHR